MIEKQLLEKLKLLRENNNNLVRDLNKVTLSNLEIERELATLKTETADLEEAFYIISQAMLEISSHVNYLKDSQSKILKNQTEGKSTKKSSKSKEKIQKEQTLKSLSYEYKDLISFLFNEYKKSVENKILK